MHDYAGERCEDPHKVRIHITIDGVPIAPRKKMWLITGTYDHQPLWEPFVIGMMFMSNDSLPTADFMLPLVNEIECIQQQQNPEIRIRAFITDAEARSIVKACMRSYTTCPRCTTEARKFCFGTETGSEKTNEAFRAYQYKDQVEGAVNPLLRLSTVDMVKDIISGEPYHAVYMGTTKRLLKKLTTSLPEDQARELDRAWVEHRLPTVVGFSTETMENLDWWTAEQLAAFLHYGGVQLAVPYFNEEDKSMWFNLYTAISMLSLHSVYKDPKLLKKAAALIDQFIEEAYGAGIPITYSLHCLKHVTEDVYRFGELPRISMFKVEKFHKRLRSRLLDQRNTTAHMPKMEIGIPFGLGEPFAHDTQKYSSIRLSRPPNVYLRAYEECDRWFVAKDLTVYRMNWAGKKEGAFIVGAQKLAQVKSIYDTQHVHLPPLKTPNMCQLEAEVLIRTNEIRSQLVPIRGNNKTVFYPLIFLGF